MVLPVQIVWLRVQEEDGRTGGAVMPIAGRCSDEDRKEWTGLASLDFLAADVTEEAAVRAAANEFKKADPGTWNKNKNLYNINI